MRTILRIAIITLLVIMIIKLLRQHGFTHIKDIRSSIQTKGLSNTFTTIMTDTRNGISEVIKERKAQADLFDQQLKSTPFWLKSLYFFAGLLGLVGLLPLLYLLMLEKHERDIAIHYWKAGFGTFLFLFVIGIFITIGWLIS